MSRRQSGGAAVAADGCLIYGVVIVSSARGIGKTFMYFIFAKFALVCGIFLEKLGVSCFVRGK